MCMFGQSVFFYFLGIFLKFRKGKLHLCLHLFTIAMVIATAMPLDERTAHLPKRMLFVCTASLLRTTLQHPPFRLLRDGFRYLDDSFD